MFEDLKAEAIAAFHDLCHASPQWPEHGPRAHEPDSLWHWLEANHRYNCQLWAEEDLARRRDVPDSAIASNKRNIDRFNQARNDAIERLDERILARLEGIAPSADAWFNSETAGSIIDRLSIVSLKILHMDRQTRRQDCDAALRAEATEKLARLRAQRADLMFCCDQLLDGFARGRAYYRIYRQFKMYNDPRMNPYLSGSMMK